MVSGSARDVESIDTCTDDSSRLRSCEANVLVIDSVVRRYRIEHGDYPANISVLVNEGYLRRPPECPLKKGAYRMDAYHHACCPEGHALPRPRMQ